MIPLHVFSLCVPPWGLNPFEKTMPWRIEDGGPLTRGKRSFHRWCDLWNFFVEMVQLLLHPPKFFDGNYIDAIPHYYHCRPLLTSSPNQPKATPSSPPPTAQTHPFVPNSFTCRKVLNVSGISWRRRPLLEGSLLNSFANHKSFP